MSQAKGGRSRAEEEPPPAADTDPRADEGESGATDHGTGHECLEWCPVCRSAELLKGVGSPEVRHQLQAIQNEALQVFRAFVTAYSERAGEDPFSRRREDEPAGERREPEPPKPADTPIDISIE